jgi:transposase
MRKKDGMTTKMTDPRTRVIGGVDTHKDVHVVAAIDGLGRLLGTKSFPADAPGYRGLLGCLRARGSVDRVGVEGCGCWGAGLARHLDAGGVTAIEVNRPNRQRRRRHGKSDAVDAENAARAVLAGAATAVPKAMTGPVRPSGVLGVARRGPAKRASRLAPSSRTWWSPLLSRCEDSCRWASGRIE